MPVVVACLLVSGTPVTYPKRLIEVDLPIKEISAHARREKSIRHGHISTLHMWWARRPLGACRAVICASLWPDPADEQCPVAFRQEAAKILCEFAAKVRSMAHLGDLSKVGMPRWQRTDPTTLRGDDAAFAWEIRYALLDFIADFANWDASDVPEFLATARAMTHAAHEACGGALGARPLVVDPFAGGGSIPFEGLRVGADVVASDLNPIPVTLNSLVLSRVPRAGDALIPLIEKLATRVHENARNRLQALYPPPPDGSALIAYLWCRTLRCPGPQCGATVPLVSSPVLAKRRSRVVGLKFEKGPGKSIKIAISEYASASSVGAATIRHGAVTCPACGHTTAVHDVRQQLQKRKGGAGDALMYAKVVRTRAGVTEFRVPEARDTNAYARAVEEVGRFADTLEIDLPLPPAGALGFRVQKYGIERWRELFTARQRLLLLTYASEVRNLVYDGDSEGCAAFETARALLGVTVSKMASFSSSLCFWRNVRTCVAQTFGRTTQTLAMLWDFGEMNPFAASAGDFSEGIEYLKLLIRQILVAVPTNSDGDAKRGDARHIALPDSAANLVCTDPPYYDSVPYGHLSEFYIYWLHACGIIQTSVAEVSERRSAECIVDDGLGLTRLHYEKAMADAMAECRRIASPGAVGVVVFAHKSTGAWEAQLQAMLDVGWTITASWPIDTERSGRPRANNSAALGSSIHMVCRPREDASQAIGDWRDVLTELPTRIHDWLPRLMKEGVVGADAIFACLGPALEIFSRYSRVEDAAGEEIKLKVYLEKVWEVVAREALSQIFTGVDTAGFEPDARLTAMWLWTLFGGASSAPAGEDGDEEEDDDDSPAKASKAAGFALEYDAARKIAQGLGAHLEDLAGLVEVKGDTARLLSVGERVRVLFGQAGAAPEAATKGKKGSRGQMALPGMARGADDEEPATQTGASLHNFTQASAATTVLDRVHQAMILFGQNRGVVLKRLLVEDGVGRDERFWRLANALNALYPTGSDERRWVEGVLTRRKALGL